MTYNTTCRYFVHPEASPPPEDTNRACHGLVVRQFIKRWTIKSTVFWAPPSTPFFQVRGLLTRAILPLTPCSVTIEILDEEKLLPRAWQRLSYCCLKKCTITLALHCKYFSSLCKDRLVSHIKVKCRLRVFESRVLRRIFGPKRDEVTGEWRRLHNEEVYALYSSPNIIRVIKSRKLRWAEHVASMGERRDA
jgi:hypothetical protein